MSEKEVPYGFDEYTNLMKAVYFGNVVECTRLLSQDDIDLTKTVTNGFNIMHEVAFRNTKETIFNIIIEKIKDKQQMNEIINKEASGTSTPLDFLYYRQLNGDTSPVLKKMINVLRQNGAKANFYNINGEYEKKV